MTQICSLQIHHFLSGQPNQHKNNKFILLLKIFKFLKLVNVDDENASSADLVNNNGFIINEYPIGTKPFRRSSSKTMRAYVQSGESYSSNMVSESCPQM